MAVGALISFAPAGAATLTAPFNQCPAVGNDTSCGVLIDAQAGGASYLSDPTQGPYDGVEDTLLGIVNNTGAPLASIHLSTPGIDSFGFDGDGICSYGVVDAMGACYGTTGYEGPGTSFANIAADSTSGDVVFNPPLAAGQSAFFSLEQALDAQSFNPPVMTGRAYALSATKSALSGTSPLIAPLPDTGQVSTSSSTVTSRPCVNYPTGSIQAHTLCSRVTTDQPTTTATASSTVADLSVGLPKVPAVLVKGIETTSTTNCTSSSGTTTVAYLQVGTTVLVNKATVFKPNTKLSVAGVTIWLNQQTAAPAGTQGLTVKGVHLSFSTGLGQSVDVVAGYANSGVSNCPAP
jgi:hypothetical protein